MRRGTLVENKEGRRAKGKSLKKAVKGVRGGETEAGKAVPQERV